MGIAAVLCGGVAGLSWAVLNSPAARERIALYEADSMRRWILSKMQEARNDGRTFSLRVPEQPNTDLILKWYDPVEAEAFKTEGAFYFQIYATEVNSTLGTPEGTFTSSSRTCFYNPKWHMFQPGFTMKLSIRTDGKYSRLKYLIVSPYARVRLSDTPP